MLEDLKLFQKMKRSQRRENKPIEYSESMYLSQGRLYMKKNVYKYRRKQKQNQNVSQNQ